MATFFIHTENGDVATQSQLAAEGLSHPVDGPQRPWFRIQGGSDVQMMWYAVMRRRHSKGVWFGALALRNTDHFEKLVSEGWEEVGVQDVGVGEHRGPGPGANDTWWTS